MVSKENKILILFAFWVMESWHMWLNFKKKELSKKLSDSSGETKPEKQIHPNYYENGGRRAV